MDQFKDLLRKYLNDTLTPEELRDFSSLVKLPANQSLVKQALGELVQNEHYIDLSGKMDTDLLFRQVMNRAALEETEAGKSTGILRRYWWAAAAVLVLACSVVYLTVKDNQPLQATGAAKDDIPPGKEGAILTLADGSQVVLDSLGSGLIATQSGTDVKLANGQLVYDPKIAAMEIPVENTMSTPKGRQFQLQLPDGTKVWLNAASSIRFPAAFKGNRRSVAITGEVYFEVAANKDQPFYVNVNNRAEITVLGTSFNVNAYANNEALRTTLVDGSIRLHAGNSLQLKPGQQGAIDGNGGLQLQKADLARTVAWKNGYFNFEGLSFREAMQQLERWYDITIDIRSEIKGPEFYGEISRNISLSDMITVLKDMGVYLKIESGRKLIVLTDKQPD